MTGLPLSQPGRGPDGEPGHRAAGHLPAGPGADQRHAAAACRRGQLVLIGLALGKGAEARLPELLLRLKNGDPAERVRYQRIRDLFTEFTQGRGCEVRLIQVQQPPRMARQPRTGSRCLPSGLPSTPATRPRGPGPRGPDRVRRRRRVGGPCPGVRARRALRVGRRAGRARSRAAPQPAAPTRRAPAPAAAQFLVITHSAELLPLADADDVRLVRLDRDDKKRHEAWPVDEDCRAKMARKLVAKGNERLPFAWRAILCEGQDDVEAL